MFYGMKHVEGDHVPSGKIFATVEEAEAYADVDAAGNSLYWRINDSQILSEVLEIVQELVDPTNDEIDIESGVNYDTLGVLANMLNALRNAGVRIPENGNEIGYSMMCYSNVFFEEVYAENKVIEGQHQVFDKIETPRARELAVAKVALAAERTTADAIRREAHAKSVN